MTIQTDYKSKLFYQDRMIERLQLELERMREDRIKIKAQGFNEGFDEANLSRKKQIQDLRGKLIDAELVIDSCLFCIKEIRAGLIWQEQNQEPHVLGKTDSELIKNAWTLLKQYKSVGKN